MDIDDGHSVLEDDAVHSIRRINTARAGRINSASLEAPEFICEGCGLDGDCDCPVCRDCFNRLSECDCVCIVCDEFKSVCGDYEFDKKIGKWYCLDKTGGSNGACKQ